MRTKRDKKRLIIFVVTTALPLAIAFTLLSTFNQDIQRQEDKLELVTRVQLGTGEEVKALVDNGGDANARDTPAEDRVKCFSDWLKRTLRPMATNRGPTMLELAARNQRHRYDVTKALL